MSPAEHERCYAALVDRAAPGVDWPFRLVAIIMTCVAAGNLVAEHIGGALQLAAGQRRQGGKTAGLRERGRGKSGSRQPAREERRMIAEVRGQQPQLFALQVGEHIRRQPLRLVQLAEQRRQCGSRAVENGRPGDARHIASHPGRKRVVQDASPAPLS